MKFNFVPAVFCLLLLSGTRVNAETVRDQEIAECRSGEVATWNDGSDRPAIGRSLRFVYRHDGSPAEFGRAQVQAMVARAVQAWGQCGITIELVAERDARVDAPDTVLVQWSDARSMGNFGLANLTQRTLSLGPQAFALLRSRNPRHDATQTLQMVVSHEMGHFFGLMAHSRRCVDVLSYYHDGKGGKCHSRDPAGINAVAEYRHVLPTACDIARCRAVNGLVSAGLK